MCSSSNQAQHSTVFPQKHWRPWEQPQMENSRNAPKSYFCRSSPLKCEFDVCNATFKRESELKRHRLSKHYKKRENCKVCRKVFTRKDNLTRHIKLAHTGDEKPYCKFCSKILSRRDAVQRHESTCPKNPSKRLEKHSNRISSESGAFPSHLERLKMKYQKSQRQIYLPGNHKVKSDMQN